jgi:hypothetical protein
MFITKNHQVYFIVQKILRGVVIVVDIPTDVVDVVVTLVDVAVEVEIESCCSLRCLRFNEVLDFCSFESMR